MNKEKLFTGLLIGAAVGALLGIMFAPAKGSETRSKIAGRGKDFSDELKNSFKDFVDDVAAKFDSAKEDVSDLLREKNLG